MLAIFYCSTEVKGGFNLFLQLENTKAADVAQQVDDFSCKIQALSLISSEHYILIKSLLHLKFILDILCMCVLLASMRMPSTFGGQKIALEPLRIRIMDSDESPCGFQESNPGLPQKQQELLTSDSCLSPDPLHLLMFKATVCQHLYFYFQPQFDIPCKEI